MIAVCLCTICNSWLSAQYICFFSKVHGTPMRMRYWIHFVSSKYNLYFITATDIHTYCKTLLIVKSHKSLESAKSFLQVFPSHQYCCQCTWADLANFKVMQAFHTQSPGFQNWWDLAIRRNMGYWIWALIVLNSDNWYHIMYRQRHDISHHIYSQVLCALLMLCCD